MRVGPSPLPKQNLRIQHWDAKDTLYIDMSWEDWDELARDVAYFRQHGHARPGSEIRISAKGLDMDATALWVPPGSRA